MEQLRRLRKEARLSQTELAELAEAALPELPFIRITVQYINDIETGRNKNPNALAVLRIAAVLEREPKELYINPPPVAALVAA